MRLVNIIVLLGFLNQVYGQNLVPNGDFEDYSLCPGYATEIFKATPWFQPNIIWGNTINSSSTDYFNSCATGISDVPSNAVGHQSALSGGGYAGIIFVCILDNGIRPNSNREYLEVELTEELERGERYCVEFYVSLAEDSYYGVDAISVYFSSDSVLYSSQEHENLHLEPQISNIDSNVILDVNTWIPVFGEYEAAGGEKFITIGNFKPDSLTLRETSPAYSGSIADMAYYYIDNVSVTKGNCLLSIDDNKQLEFSIFPNPATSSIAIKTTDDLGGEIRLIDIFGNTLSEFSFRGNEIEVDVSNLTPSVYYLFCKTEKGSSVKKFVKM